MDSKRKIEQLIQADLEFITHSLSAGDNSMQVFNLFKSADKETLLREACYVGKEAIVVSKDNANPSNGSTDTGQLSLSDWLSRAADYTRD